jgi:(E)-4-hydroxy-3-methylbut-2-enyl-diphosphate synthase
LRRRGGDSPAFSPAAGFRIMSVRPYRDIQRRKSRQIRVGSVLVGGDAPISVQTMTNTLTKDVEATIAQVKAAAEAGADIVRVSCPDEDSTAALKEIVKQATVPIVADFHFHYKRGIEAAEAGAACLRINPGNIGSAERVREVVKAAKDHGCSMRIGVNAGSLERDLLERYGEPCPEAMVESALTHAKILEDHDFREFKISVKASDPFLAVAAYQGLADACDYPLHLGITEAGGLRTGTVKSAIGLGSLLWAGIGDTIRVSLSADPVEEVKVGFDILKSLNLRHRGVNLISCPSCARQNFDVIKTVEALEKRIAHITTPMSVSIIGCVVNGPGEARETDIGFTGGGNDTHMVYIAGQQHHRLKNQDIVEHMAELIEKKAAEIEAAKAAEKAKQSAAAE